MSRWVICTIGAKNYVAQARCLADSFLAQHPDGRVFFLLVDELDGSFDPDGERFTTLLATDIGIANFQQMAFRYTVVELSTAVKPFFLQYLFRRYGFEQLCYFDPDIFFYASVDHLFELLDSYGILLIPHITGFLDDEFRPNELDILRSGAYNLGFIGLAQHAELDLFLTWWQRKLAKRCTLDVDRGLFVDQRWMDLTPTLFSSVYIHRDPGCNVAFWNLPHRAIQTRESRYVVNDSLLKFFHFSGFSPANVEAISKHQSRHRLDDFQNLKQIFYDYRDCLLANGYDQLQTLQYAYDYFDNGVRIPEFARYLWREVDGDGERWPDPFNTTHRDSFLVWLNEPADSRPRGQPLITNLALEVYRRRTDLQEYFRDVLGQDRRAFVEWFTRQAQTEHDLDDVFTKPMADSLSQACERRDTSTGLVVFRRGHRDWGRRFYLRVTSLLLRAHVGVLIQRALGDRLICRIRNMFFAIGRDPPRMPYGDSILPPRTEVD